MSKSALEANFNFFDWPVCPWTGRNQNCKILILPTTVKASVLVISFFLRMTLSSNWCSYCEEIFPIIPEWAQFRQEENGKKQKTAWSASKGNFQKHSHCKWVRQKTKFLPGHGELLLWSHLFHQQQVQQVLRCQLKQAWNHLR